MKILSIEMLLINLKCNWKLIPFHCTLLYLNLTNAIFQLKILENSLHVQKNEGSCSNYLTYLSIFHVKIFFMKCSKNIKLLSEESFFFAYFTIIKLSVVSKMSITRIILQLIYTRRRYWRKRIEEKRKNVKKQRRHKSCAFNIA